MCVALPMKIMEVDADKHAVVEFDGVQRRISLRLLPDAAAGDFVLIHAGYAIEKLDEGKAVEQLRLLEELKAGLDL